MVVKGLLLAFTLLFAKGLIVSGSVCPCPDDYATLAEQNTAWMCEVNLWRSTLAEWKELVEQECSLSGNQQYWMSLFSSCPDFSKIRCADESMRREEFDLLHCAITSCDDGRYVDQRALRKIWRKYLKVYQNVTKFYRKELQYCRQRHCDDSTPPAAATTAASVATTAASNTDSDTTSRVTTTDGETTVPSATENAAVSVTTASLSYETVSAPFQFSNCRGVPAELAKFRNATGGVFDLMITGVGMKEVYCNTEVDGGNWTVFQRRMDGSVDFYRNWDDYVVGFGDAKGEYWLGLEAIYQLTKDGNAELRIDMIEENSGAPYYAKYSSFKIGPASDNYRLNVSEPSGNITDAFQTEHNGRQFSTKDRDNDNSYSRRCAIDWHGAWWYNQCSNLHSNLNGWYGRGNYDGLGWYTGNWNYMRFTEMKIRTKP